MCLSGITESCMLIKQMLKLYAAFTCCPVPDTSLMYLFFFFFFFLVKCPTPMKNRDFVTQRSWNWNDDDFIIFNHSVHHKVTVHDCVLPARLIFL